MKRSAIKIMARLITLVGSLAYVIILAVINGSIGNLVGICIPVLGSLGIAKLLGENIILSYELIFTLLVVLGLLRGVLKYFEQYSNHYIAFKLLAKLRDIIFTKLRILAPAKLDTKQKGSIISMLTADIETIEVFYAHTISPICIALVVSITMFLFTYFVISPIVGIYLLVSYLIIGVILPIISNKFISKKGGKYRKSFTKFNSSFMDLIKGSKDIVLHNKKDIAINEVKENTADLIITNKKLKDSGLVFSSITDILIILLDLGLLLLGIYLVHLELLTLPLLIVGLVSLMSSYGPVLALNQLPNNLSQTFSSGNRILDLLAEKPLVLDIKDKDDFEFENLKVTDLCFNYNEDNSVLNHFNFEISKGEIIGIMGKSGCGKSTFLKLLLRFFKKESGSILYNGIDIENINTKSLKQNVFMVSQSTYLFNDTILNNILISKKTASKEEVIEACKKASIHDLIMSLENGYDTVVGMGGVSLSAGETQRLGIARAFLSDAKLLLLDEMTSNVDAINEGIILSSLIKNKEDKAIIIVSHRKSTMEICKKVYNL